MGTDKAKLVLLETPCLPLLSWNSFCTWMGGAESVKNYASFTEELYGGNSSDDSDVPSGLVALWKLMTTSRKDLVGPIPLKSDELGDMIGFGSFAAVYKHKKVAAHVIKLSRYGAKVALEKEAAVLEELQHDASGGGSCADYVPRVVSFGYLKVETGGVDVTLPALVMEPRGISVEAKLAKVDVNERSECLLSIGENLTLALQFVHEKGYLHNDVSLKNMMYNEEKEKAFLIDFGLASKVNEKVTGFRGTTIYAHHSIFTQYPNKTWCPKSEYDFTSLAFSMAVLSNGGKCTWKPATPFDPVIKKNEDRINDLRLWAKKRSLAALGFLEKGGFSGGPWTEWADDTACYPSNIRGTAMRN
jgi:serine/threonine protein kinase